MLEELGDWSVQGGVSVVKAMAAIGRQACATATRAGNLIAIL